jgi:hypothetical protein
MPLSYVLYISPFLKGVFAVLSTDYAGCRATLAVLRSAVRSRKAPPKSFKESAAWPYGSGGFFVRWEKTGKKLGKLHAL